MGGDDCSTISAWFCHRYTSEKTAVRLNPSKLDTTLRVGWCQVGFCKWVGVKILLVDRSVDFAVDPSAPGRMGAIRPCTWALTRRGPKRPFRRRRGHRRPRGGPGTIQEGPRPPSLWTRRDRVVSERCRRGVGTVNMCVGGLSQESRIWLCL